MAPEVRAERVTTHPLDSLTTAELARAVELLRADERWPLRGRLVELTLHEPEKALVLAWSPGAPLVREAYAIVHDPETGAAAEVLVSLTDGRVSSWTPRPGVQAAITPEEFLECERVVRADEGFRAALSRRGVEDTERVVIEAWGIGGLAPERHQGRRLAWTPCWVRPDDQDNPYAKPIEGLFAIVDLNEMTVLEIEDHGVVPFPTEQGRYFPEDLRLRDDVKPFEAVQPEGPSFVVDGWEIRWQKWRLRLGFTPREGLIVHQVGYEDESGLRPVLYRASIAELVVPYGDPGPGNYRKNAFDIGEYGLGPLTNSLALGCDCLGEIYYFNVDLCDDLGRPYTIRNAICLHEEDAGLLWKHYDAATERAEVRRSRRLVISFIATLANYEYAFYWYLYQDGSIGFDVALTGIVITSALAAGETPTHGTLVAPGLSAPYHQHFFTLRLDLDVDGTRNSVYEVDTETDAVDERNPYGVAFSPVARRIERESGRQIDQSKARFWKVVNEEARNGLGGATGYRLVPGPNVLPFAAGSADVLRRAGYLRNHLWVTPYARAERFPAGDYPNQSDGSEGLPAWTQAARRTADADIVLWYTLGSHHITRPEDWPVMPVERIGFMLKPDGFFDRSAALDVPPTKGHHCHAPHGDHEPSA